MPSTRISMCLICAATGAANTQPSSNTSAKVCFRIVSPFSQMKTELLGNSEADMAPHWHEQRARGVRHIPIHAEPDVHARTQAHVGRRPELQYVAAAAALRESADAVVLRVQPGQGRPDKPLASHVLRFVWAVRQPEARFQVVAQPCLLRSLRANDRMEVFVRHQPAQVE